MSCTVLVVDDEAVARVGLTSSIPWESAGLRLVGQAGDGRKALELIRRESPDIVLTDIVMPVMDGLELMRRAQSLPSPPRFVVLSAYDDFPKVREAMRLGAADYLLKADVRARTVLAALRPLVAEISQARPSGATGRPARDGEASGVLRRSLVRDAIAGYYASEPDFRAALDRLGLGLQGQRILCATIKIGETYRFEDLSEQELESLNRRVIGVAEAVLAERRSAHCFEVRTGEFSTLMEWMAPQNAIPLCARAAEMLKQYLNMNAIIGLGDGTLTLEGVLRAHERAGSALRNRFLDDATGPVFTYTDQTLALMPPTDYSPVIYRDRLERALVRHDGDDVKEMFARILDDLSTRQLARDDLRSAALELYCMVCELLVREGLPHTGVLLRSSRPSAHLAYLDSFAEVRAWLDVLKQDLVAFTEAEGGRDYPLVIARARQYIQQHYPEELTLATVARAASLNPSYFSTLFKHHTGEGFTVYLNRVRVERAKELLRSTNHRIYVVAERVGFQNPYHFSRVFKRLVGRAPRLYRGSSG